MFAHEPYSPAVDSLGGSVALLALAPGPHLAARP